MKKLPPSTTLKEARKAGRLGDSELVHLNPAEVKMLEDMSLGHGLTINPQTGEKEAFLPFLLSMLPTLFPSLGAGLAGMTGISALANPLMLGALGSGLGTFAETGDIGKGIAAGLGGAALGGLGGQLFGGAAGSAAGKLGELANPAIGSGVVNSVGNVVKESIGSALPKAALTQAAAAPAAGGLMSGMGGMLAPMIVGAPGAYLTAQDQMDVGESDSDKRRKAAIERAQHENFMGARQVNSAPGGYRHGMDREFSFFTPGGTLTPVTTNRGFADGGLVEALTPFSPFLSLMQGKLPLGIPGLLDYNKPGTPESRAKEEEEARLAGRAPATFADGGLVPQVQPALPVRPMMPIPRAIGPQMAMAGDINGGGNPNIGVWGGLQLPPRQIPTPYTPAARGPGIASRGGGGGEGYFGGGQQTMAYGGGRMHPNAFQQRGVAQFAEGGMVMGPGDGTSDSVPAMINGSEPAALSDGEFVVPAMAVAALGNGSSKAGAAKLQEMVNSLMAAA